MTFTSVCSGIGAPECAWKSLGWQQAFSAEIEPFPSAVLAHHVPSTKNYGDITKFNDWPDSAIDLLVGGTPCQSFSVAGLRAGLADPRGNLALTFLGIIERYRPQWVVWENVCGVHSSWSDAENGHATEASREAESVVRRLAAEAGIDEATISRLGGFEECEQTSDFDSFLSGLEELGYGIATRVFDAQYFNLAQRRERVFVVGCLGGAWQRAAAVLFDAASLCGNSPPSRATRQGIAPTISERAQGGGVRGTDFDCDGGCIPTQHGVCATLTKNYATHHGRTAGNNGGVAENQLIPMVLAHGQANAEQVSDGSPSLTCDHEPPICFQPRHFTRGNKTGGSPAEIAMPLCAAESRSRGDAVTAIQSGFAVRRLTPTECERLMGFPDGWTAIKYRGKPAADGPRYKALGNSMAVPVLTWIGRRINLIESLSKQT